MAGIEFDRQIFTPAAEAQRAQAPKAMGMILLVLALGLAGLVGYKVFTQASQSNAIASANAQVEQLQQQLAESQKRVEELEKHRRQVKVEVAAPAPQPVVVAKNPAPAKPVYRIAAGSALPPQPKPVIQIIQPQPAVKSNRLLGIERRRNRSLARSSAASSQARFGTPFRLWLILHRRIAEQRANRHSVGHCRRGNHTDFARLHKGLVSRRLDQVHGRIERIIRSLHALPDGIVRPHVARVLLKEEMGNPALVRRLDDFRDPDGSMACSRTFIEISRDLVRRIFVARLQ